MNFRYIPLAVTLVAVLATTAFAQTSGYQRHHVATRKGVQQSRIAQGVRSGQLTPREAGRVEHQEAGINREERGMRAQDGGHLTAQDRHALAHQQNQESRRIYNQKHDGQTDHGVPPR